MTVWSDCDMEDLDKKYYKIKDVSILLGVPQSTLRYWETQFPECSPRRSKTGLRYYTPDDIETLRKIQFLLRDKGLRIDAARQELHDNPGNVSRRLEILDRLTATRAELQEILDSLGKRQ